MAKLRILLVFFFTFGLMAVIMSGEYGGPAEAQGATQGPAKTKDAAARKRAGQSAPAPAPTTVPSSRDIDLALETRQQPSKNEPKVTILKNGLTVLIQEDDRFPLVSERLYVHAGSGYESASQAGISHLLEHMVFKGTSKRAPGQVAQDIESVGGYLNAATSFDYTMFMVDVPSQHWDLGLDVIQDMIFGAKLAPEELAQEKNVVLSELERGEDDPSQLLFKSMQKSVWGDAPYGRPVIGFPDTLKPLTSDNVREYIRTFYQPQSMLLVVCGKVQADQVLERVQGLFGSLADDRALTPPDPLPVPRTGDGPVVEVRPGQWNKVYLSVAFPIPGFKAQEAAGLEVLAQLLGGDKTSRLYRKFNYETRMVDDISASAVGLERAGMFHIAATLDPAKLDTFWSALVAELKGLSAASFTDEELARAKLNLEDDLFQAKETLSGLASKLGHFQFFDGSYREEDNYIYSLAHVDKPALQGLISRYFGPDRLHAVLLVPEKPGAAAAPGTAGAPGAAGETVVPGPAGAAVPATPMATIDKDRLAAQVRQGWPRPERKLAEAESLEAKGGMERIQIGPGQELVLIPDTTLPYTSVSLLLNGGDALLSPAEQGLAELAAKSLALGTKEMKATRYQDYLSDRASRISTTAGRETFSVSAKFPSRFSTDILGLFRNVLLNPAFAPEDVARARQDQTASIRSREDEPLGLAFMHIFPFLFPGSSYGYFHLGTPEALAGYDRAKVASFWDRQLRRPWVMAVCGYYDRDAVLALAKAVAAGTGGESFSFSDPGWGSSHDKDLRLAGRNQTHLILTFPTVGMDNPDSAGLSLLRAVLAGQGGILFRELRDRQGLGYTVTSFLWQAPRTGFISFYIGTTPDKAEQAMDGFRRVVGEITTKPITTDELDRAKNLLQGEYYRDHQSLSSRSQEAASLLVKGLPVEYNQALIDKAKALTPEDVRVLAAKYLNWDGKYVMRVEP